MPAVHAWLGLPPNCPSAALLPIGWPIGRYSRPVRRSVDDCLFFEARAISERHIESMTRVERIPLAAASGRVLAETIISTTDVPPFARAAMDGYAVRAADTTGASRSTPRVLELIDKVFTGQVSTSVVGAGQCIEIATGAPMPAGADAVVIVEDTSSDDASTWVAA